MKEATGLESLNDVQREAVQHKDGPLLLLSGAGSGKTRVITHRIAYLIRHHDVSPNNILAVTFTNKAAAEMKTRLNDLIGKTNTPFWVNTFHACCTRILRKYITHLDYGYDRSFTIYNNAKQLALIKNLIQTLHINLNDPKRVLATISRIKRGFISPEEHINNAGGFFEKSVARIYSKYQNFLRKENALDFDDMITLTVELFDVNPKVLNFYQDLFRYILVDEYQDTDGSQYRLVRTLAQKHRNLCAVGDDNQSIYLFRGADLNNILDFEKDYPDATVLHLQQNYRSTKNILEAAHHVIRNNRKRKPNQIWTENERGSKIICYRSNNETNEATYVQQQIQNWRARGRKYKDLAILYRINAQSRTFEEALRGANIPYQIVGGIRFYERLEIKDIIAYMRVIVNSADTESIKRIINTPRRGIGNETVQKIEAFARSEGIPLFEAIQRVEEIPTISDAAKNSVSAFARLILLFSPNDPPARMAENLLDRSGYLQALRSEGTIEAQSREENLHELIAAVTEYETNDPKPTLAGFLENIVLASATDDKEGNSDKVKMMTLHGTKGLEFPFVFIVGMEEGLLPHWRSCNTEDELEEERRLCYVGITRAQEQLYLIHSDSRGLHDRNPSRFISEIPAELMKLEWGRTPDPKKATVDSAEKPIRDFKTGADESYPTRETAAAPNRNNTPRFISDKPLNQEPLRKPMQQPTASANVHLNRGITSLREGNYDLAIRSYDKAIELKPDSIFAYNGRGRAYYEKGDYDRAVTNCTKAIKLKPDYTDAYYNRGMAYYEKDENARAIADHTKAIKLQPDYTEAYYNRGRAYYENGDYDRTIVDYTKAIKLKPDYATAYNNRGVAYAKKGNYPYAIADYTKAIELQPDYAEVYYNRGVAYAKKDDYPYAIADYTKAIELKSDYATAYNNRGQAYYEKGDYPRAAADYDKAIELKPSIELPSNAAETYNYRGEAHWDKGDYDRAIVDYTKAIKLKTDDAYAYYNRGWAYHAEGDYDRAIVDYTKAIKLKPDYADAYDYRGEAYQRKGDDTRAEADRAKAEALENARKNKD